MSEVICPSCRTANEAGAVFCGNCGARMAPTAPQPPQFQAPPAPPQYGAPQTPPQYGAPTPPPPQYGAPQPPQYGAPPYQQTAPGYQQPMQPGYGAPGYPTGAQAVPGVPVGMVPAGFWIRVGAQLIDAIILFVVGYALGLAGLDSPIISLLLGTLYFMCFWAILGTSPGKMALGLRIITADGQPMNWAKAGLRYALFFVSGLSVFTNSGLRSLASIAGLVLLGGLILLATDAQKRALHDRLAGTMVVKKA